MHRATQRETNQQKKKQYVEDKGIHFWNIISIVAVISFDKKEGNNTYDWSDGQCKSQS